MGPGTSVGLMCVCGSQHVRVPVPLGGVHVQAGRQSSGRHDPRRTFQIAGGNGTGEHRLCFFCGGVVVVYPPHLNWKNSNM